MKKKPESLIRTFYRTHKRMPNVSEVMTLFGYASRSSAFYVMQKLVESGLLQKDERGKIVPGELFYALPRVGRVRAGFAAPMEEELADTIGIGDYLIRDKEGSYLLQVEGDSMIDAGIHEGDMVIFERTTSFKPGDIVVALTEDGYTLKYLRRRANRFFLEPANTAYPNIYPKEGQIIGVITGSFRKYK